MAHTGPRAVARGGDGVAGHGPVGHFRQPEVALDGCAADQAAHEIDDAILGRGCVDCGAVTGKGIAAGEVEPARGPGIGRVLRGAGDSGSLGRIVWLDLARRLGIGRRLAGRRLQRAERRVDAAAGRGRLRLRL